jgi:UDP-N-acetylglucosamine:LPS N-acetylglucosamine transferase
LLEQKIYNQLKIKNYKTAFVRGVQDNSTLQSTENTEVFERLDSKSLLQLIHASDLIICRSGYSSIMDMIRLRKTAVLIPTPGQTEQEYLADYLHKKGMFFSISQNEFCIDNIMQNKISFNAENKDDEGAALTQCILDLENRINIIKNYKRRN